MVVEETMVGVEADGADEEGDIEIDSGAVDWSGLSKKIPRFFMRFRRSLITSFDAKD